MAVLAMGMTLTACSVDDNPAVETDIPGEPPSGGIVANVKLTRDAGIVFLNDGDIVEGIGGQSTKLIIIAARNNTNTTVKLLDVDLTAYYGTPVIDCYGNVNLILVGETKTRNSLITVFEGDTLTISGNGSLIADGTYPPDAAAIGSTGEHGDFPHCGHIVITGGNITAIGGSEGGAAIGAGGNGGICDGITITGGKVTAISQSDGAAIGSGSGNDTSSGSYCGDITITGGKIIAKGQGNGASIGTGKKQGGPSTCGNITITSGVEYVACMLHDYWIGEGEGGTCGTITIDGRVMKSEEFYDRDEWSEDEETFPNLYYIEDMDEDYGENWKIEVYCSLKHKEEFE